MDHYSKFENVISHKVQELKSSAADDISIIFIPIKNHPGKCCGVWSKKEKYSLKHDESSLLNFTLTECQS